jgi:hypothetical protein
MSALATAVAERAAGSRRSTVKRVLRSTRVTIADHCEDPMMRSPSQFPAWRRLSTWAGLVWIERMDVDCFMAPSLDLPHPRRCR